MAKASGNGGRTWLLLLGAIGFGVIAAVMSVMYLKSREAALLARLGVVEEQTVAVVVANQNITKGTRLTPAIAAVREIPVEYVHADAITPGMFDRVQDKVLVENVDQGKPILRSFIDEEFPLDFSDTIAIGRRAMTINVDEIASQANMTRPGNHIDLYFNIAANVVGFEVPGMARPTVAGLPLGATTGPIVRDVVMPILQDVRVLATGREGYDDFQEQLLRGRMQDYRYTTMTVDVSPKQAALLANAMDKGNLIALLRNRKDRGGAHFTGITTADLLEHAEEMRRNALVQASQRSADGLIVAEDGTIMTRDGIVLKDQNLTVDADGRLRTKGKTYTDYVMNEDGSVTLPDGTVLQPGEFTVNPDGSITTKGVDLTGLGLTVNENGELVLPDGTVVNADDIIVTEDGVVMTRDGRIISTPEGRVTEDGFIITPDGRVMTPDGVVLDGVTVTEDGRVITADGRVLRAEDVVLNPDGSISVRGETHTDFTRNPDGSVTLADGTVLQKGEFVVNPDGSITALENVAGVTGRHDPIRASTMQAMLGITDPTDVDVERMLRFIGYIRGGDSQDGVAKPGIIPILPVKQGEQALGLESLLQEQLQQQLMPTTELP